MDTDSKIYRRVTINYIRVGNDITRYTGILLDDDGERIKVYSQVPDKVSRRWSRDWQARGFVPDGALIRSVVKYHFYQEYFSVMELRGTAEHLLGYYSDITTPVRKVGQEYAIEDVVLDIWIAPDGTVRELDWAEFATAIQRGLLSERRQRRARETMERLRTEIAAGTFPSTYIDTA